MGTPDNNSGQDYVDELFEENFDMSCDLELYKIEPDKPGWKITLHMDSAPTDLELTAASIAAIKLVNPRAAKTEVFRDVEKLVKWENQGLITLESESIAGALYITIKHNPGSELETFTDEQLEIITRISYRFLAKEDEQEEQPSDSHPIDDETAKEPLEDDVSAGDRPSTELEDAMLEANVQPTAIGILDEDTMESEGNQETLDESDRLTIPAPARESDNMPTFAIDYDEMFSSEKLRRIMDLKFSTFVVEIEDTNPNGDEVMERIAVICTQEGLSMQIEKDRVKGRKYVEVSKIDHARYGDGMRSEYSEDNLMALDELVSEEHILVIEEASVTEEI